MSRLSFMTVALYLDYMSENSSGGEDGSLKKAYDSIFQDVKAAGYEWVDLSSWETDALGVKCLLLLLQKYELKVSSYIQFESFAEVQKDPDAALLRARDGVDKAVVLGSEYLMIGAMNLGNLSDTDPKKIRTQLVGYFTGVCAYAREMRICPVIENVPDAGLDLCKWEDVRSAMDAVPQLEYIYDCGTALVAEQGAAEYLPGLKDRLAYVHLKDMKETAAPGPGIFESVSGKFLVNAPTGKGLVDMKDVLEQLKNVGYKGRLSVEFCPDEDMPLADSIMRSKEYIEELL